MSTRSTWMSAGVVLALRLRHLSARRTGTRPRPLNGRGAGSLSIGLTFGSRGGLLSAALLDGAVSIRLTRGLSRATATYAVNVVNPIDVHARWLRTGFSPATTVCRRWGSRPKSLMGRRPFSLSIGLTFE